MLILLLGTVTAFTAPLIYLQNQEFIDEQICQAGKLVNAQLANGRHLTEKYAGEAAARARATAGDLSQKVQVYTRGPPHAATTQTQEKSEFPAAPVHEPVHEPAHVPVHVPVHESVPNDDANGMKETEYRHEQPILEAY